MATVSKRKWTHAGVENEAWVVRYTDQSGKRRMKTFDRKKDADRYRTHVEVEIEKGEHTPDSESALIRNLAKVYLEHIAELVEAKSLSRESYASIDKALRLDVIPQLGNVRISELTADHVIDLAKHMRSERGLSNRVVMERRAIFKRFETWARRRGYTKKSVVLEGIRDFPLRIEGELRVPTPADILRVRQAIEERAYKAHPRAHLYTKITVHLAMFCGLRYGETQALCLQNIDLEKRILKVRHSLTRWDELKSPKTKSGVRDVPLPRHLADMIADWIARYYIENDRKLLLLSSGGRPINGMDWNSSYWYPLLKRAGLYGDETTSRLRFHALRHFAASWWIENGLPIPRVAKLLGHSKPDITLRIYSHALRDAEEEMAALDTMSTALLMTPETATPAARATPAQQMSN